MSYIVPPDISPSVAKSRGPVRVLGLPGSLRAASINRAWLETLRDVAPEGIEVQVWRGVGELPLFNPDLTEALPGPVQAFHCAVNQADALLVAGPEYAHGVSGCLKNALDWLVGLESFAGKPVAVLNASPRASHADAALREILSTMAARIVESASVTLPLLGRGLDAAGMRSDVLCVETSRALLHALGAVVMG